MDPDPPSEPPDDRAETVLPLPPGLRAGLAAIYGDLADDLDALRPRCDLSGRCCRFVEFDHTLFLTEAEALLLLADAPPPARPLDDGATCPWQDARGLCTARDARPLGCRVYFCDPAYQDTAPELSERYLARLRALTESLGLPWNYAPLHAHLRSARAGGRFGDPPAAGPATTSGDESTHST